MRNAPNKIIEVEMQRLSVLVGKAINCRKDLKQELAFIVASEPLNSVSRGVWRCYVRSRSQMRGFLKGGHFPYLRPRWTLRNTMKTAKR